MRPLILCCAVALGLAAADGPPVVPDAKKLAIREAELALSRIAAERAEIQLRWLALDREQPKAQARYEAALQAATVEGYQLLPDLTLQPRPKPAATKEKQ